MLETTIFHKSFSKNTLLKYDSNHPHAHIHQMHRRFARCLARIFRI
jgi:hypothetical protein